MLRILPIIFLLIVVSGGLIYWRYFAQKPVSSPLTSAQPVQKDEVEDLVEVPKTLPNATVEDRVKVLEEAIVELIKRVNSSANQTTDSSINTRLDALEASITDLKVQVSTLGQTAPTPSSSKGVAYIPLGSGGSWNYNSWTTLTDYQITLDPANFPGYTGVVLEVIFRVIDPTSTAYVRLYNSSDLTIVSSEVSTASSSFVSLSSSSFKLASGSKTYVLQAKNSTDKTFIIQLARLKVNY